MRIAALISKENQFFNFSIYVNLVLNHLFTTLPIRRSRSSAPFWVVFLISVVLSLGAVLQLSNITPGGNEARVVGKNTRRNPDNKKKQ